MKILDRRPSWEKYLLERWSHRVSSASAPKTVRGPARWWSAWADRWISKRVGSRNPTTGGAFTVSVGNLALGGTGKTPVCMALAQNLARQGFCGAVLTRGYRSRLAGPVEVTPDLHLAGDEARLLAQALLPVGWLVVQARNRREGLRYLHRRDVPLDFILLEDGHQTAQVGRDLDVVILDAWDCSDAKDGPEVRALSGAVFPFGPYRESAEGARRAGILLVESDENLPTTAAGGQQLATFQRNSSWQATRQDQPTSPENLVLGVVSGIARPESFEQSVARMAGAEIRVAVRYQDHQPYGPGLVTRLVGDLRREGVTAMVTTAKDWIKLEPFWEGDIPVWISRLEISWGQQNVLPRLVREHALKRYPDLPGRRG